MQDERAAQEQVKAFLAKAGARVSEADVIAGTGLGVFAVKAALYDLMRRYVCALDVGEGGTLVYDFGDKLRPLHKPTWGERLRGVGRALWRGFSFVYKASLAVILVAYAVTFVVLIVAAAIAASAATKDEGPAEGAFHLVALIFRAIFEFATFSALTYGDTDRHGYPHKHFEPKKPVLPRRKPKEHDKSFIASVYDFVLGPKRVEIDDRAQQREVAAFVRSHGGVLTISDVQALSGLSRAEAERFFAAFVAEFEGSAEISEQGSLYATFPDLLRSSSDEQDEPIIYYWDEYEPPFELTGNTTGKNLTVAALAAFNLVCSLFAIGYLGDGGTALAWLGVIPASIFSLFFAIPALRAPWVWWQNRKQHLNNIRKRLFRAIFGSKEEQLSFGEVVDQANSVAKTEERLDADKLKPLLEETLRQVGGQLDMDTRDQLVMDLARLRGEETARQEHKLEVEQEEVVFTTRG